MVVLSFIIVEQWNREYAIRKPRGTDWDARGRWKAIVRRNNRKMWIFLRSSTVLMKLLERRQRPT